MSGESSAGADGQAGQRKAPPPGTESRPSTRRACLRLEFISERQTRCILFIQVRYLESCSPALASCYLPPAPVFPACAQFSGAG